MKKLFIVAGLLTASSFAFAMEMDPFKQDPFAKDAEGNTALHRAVNSPRVDMDVVGDLITRGADVNAVNNNGETPLHRSVWQGSDPGTLRVIQRLVVHGARLDIKNIWDQTPIEKAKSKGFNPVLIMWLRGGAKERVTDQGVMVRVQ